MLPNHSKPNSTRRERTHVSDLAKNISVTNIWSNKMVARFASVATRAQPKVGDEQPQLSALNSTFLIILGMSSTADGGRRLCEIMKFKG